MFTMLNHQEIIARIEAIREKEGLSAAAFAQRIGVPRSSISHLISGRNKPSLDLLVKIVALFPDISLDSLVFGKPAPPLNQPKPALQQKETPNPNAVADLQASLAFETPPTETSNVPVHKPIVPPSKNSIRHVILLTEDGQFETYSPKS